MKDKALMGLKTPINAIQLTLSRKIGYGMGNLSYGIIFQMIGSYMVFYATAVLGIPGSLVGVVLSISVFWDAVSDLLMGYISDITSFKRFGRRHFYILSGSLFMAVFNLFLWNINSQWSGYVKIFFLIFFLLVVKSSITVYSTPYTALGAELSNDYNERTAIQGIKTVFFLIGIMFATVMGMFLFFNPTPEYAIGQLNPAAYRNMGITSSLIALFFGVLCYFSTRQYIPFLTASIKEKIEETGIKAMMKSFSLAFKNKQYKYIVYAYLFTNISSALINTLGLHVFTYTFRLNNHDIGIIFGALFAVSILSQPLWIQIARKMDKKPTALLGLSISIVGCMLFLLLVIFKNQVIGNFVYLLPFAVITGFGTGALYSLPFSMIADTIDLEELNIGIRSEGVYYGCLTLFYKLSQSITIFIAGVLLDIVHFDSTAEIQPDSTVVALGMMIAIGGIISFFAAMLNYGKYDLNQKRVEEIQKEILLKKASQS